MNGKSSHGISRKDQPGPVVVMVNPSAIPVVLKICRKRMGLKNGSAEKTGGTRAEQTVDPGQRLHLGNGPWIKDFALVGPKLLLKAKDRPSQQLAPAFFFRRQKRRAKTDVGTSLLQAIPQVDQTRWSDSFTHGADIGKFGRDTGNARVPGLVKALRHHEESAHSCPDGGSDNRFRFILSRSDDPENIRTNSPQALDSPEVMVQVIRAFKNGNQTGDLAVAGRVHQ